MERLAIGAVARRMGLRPSAIRYYERVGVLPEPQRVRGQRRYDARVLDLLRVIAAAKRAGLTLAEVRSLMRGMRDGRAPSAAWGDLARRKHRELDAVIARARAAQRVLARALECRCATLEACALLGAGAP